MENRKVVLLHGWGWRLYSNICESNCPWQSRPRFFNEISTRFSVETVRFPGFCNQLEPEQPWDLDDFASFLDKVCNETSPALVVGYSFGGAVAVHWKHVHKSRTPVALVSPAISRRYSKLNLSLGDYMPSSTRRWVGDYYLKYIVRNPYFRYGSEFVRESYRNIVKVDLRSELAALKPSEVSIIFGSEDTATPPEKLISYVRPEFVDQIHILENAGHNVGETHSRQVLDIIEEFYTLCGLHQKK